MLAARRWNEGVDPMKCRSHICFVAAVGGILAFGHSLHARILFYPNLLTVEKNLFDECEWTPPNQSFEKGEHFKTPEGRSVLS